MILEFLTAEARRSANFQNSYWDARVEELLGRAARARRALRGRAARTRFAPTHCLAAGAARASVTSGVRTVKTSRRDVLGSVWPVSRKTEGGLAVGPRHCVVILDSWTVQFGYLILRAATGMCAPRLDACGSQSPRSTEYADRVGHRATGTGL